MLYSFLIRFVDVIGMDPQHFRYVVGVVFADIGFYLFFAIFAAFDQKDLLFFLRKHSFEHVK